VIVLVIVAVPGLGALRARLAHADAGWVLGAAMLEAASVASFAIAFHRAFVPGLTGRHSASLATTAQGVNVLVPAGGTGGLAAVTVLMARSGMARDFVISRMVALFVITGVLTNVLMVIVAGIGVSVGMLPGHASTAESMLPAVLALAMVVTVCLLVRRRDWGAKRDESDGRTMAIVRHGLSQVQQGLRWSVRLLRAGDPLLTLGAAGFVLFDLAALVSSFRAVESTGLPLGTMMLAYTLGQIGSVVSLPGTTEGGLLGVLVLYGAPVGASVSAILVYRAAQTLVPLALGLVGVMGLCNRYDADLTPEVGDLALDSPARRS
jgi:uncharacterized membrane protein YbhN (UPF0104 family)